MIRDLRTPDDKSIVEPEIMSLSTSHILPEKTCRPYVRILPEGDFLMTTLLIRETLRGTHRLRRISAQGTVLWSVDLDGIMTRPAIGKDSVYFIHGPCHRTSRDRYKMLSFAKYNLYDGSKVFDVAMPPETQAKRKIQDLDRTLELTRNECWASWRRNSRYEVYFFSTSSGQLLKTSYEPRSVPPRLLESTSPSLQTAGFWITTSHTIELTTNDEVPGYLSDAKFYFYVDDKSHSSSSPIAFDGNHSVFLRTLHAPVGLGARDTDRANPFAQFAISPIEVVSAIELTSAEGAATVTLPGQSDGKRRDFELELPWELEEGDFFGMMDEYLIYQSPKNEFLVLVDFWPAW